MVKGKVSGTVPEHELMLTMTALDRARLVAFLQAALPWEGCGFLAGEAGHVRAIYPVPNRLQRADCFEMAPREQVAALLAIEAAGLSLLAIYHSHPQGDACPSPVDVAQSNYSVAHIIVSLRNRLRPVVRAFVLDGGQPSEIPIRVQR